MVENLKIRTISIPGGSLDQMRETIRRIGDAIHRGSLHLPTRNLAAGLATTADHKDYYGQAKAIFHGFLNRWRYVHDPLTRELLTESPNASYRLVMAGDGVGVGQGRGAGDCDCATVALGAMFESVGLPVRIATMATPDSPPGQLMSHVYPEVFIPRRGWITADPVAYPQCKFGQRAKASRRVYYDLTGKVIRQEGNLRGDDMMSERDIPDIWARAPMQTFGVPNEWSTVGLKDFGCSAPNMGILHGLGQYVEVDGQETAPWNNEAVRTPLVELRPSDFAFLAQYLIPYSGMRGVSDNGDIIEYDGLSGFWKKLKRAAKATATWGGSEALRKKAAKEASKKREMSPAARKKLHEAFVRANKHADKLLKDAKKKRMSSTSHGDISAGHIRKGIGLETTGKAAANIASNIQRVTSQTGNGKVAVNISGDVKEVQMRIIRPIPAMIGKNLTSVSPVAAFVPGPGPAMTAVEKSKKKALKKKKKKKTKMMKTAKKK
jgi:hypothetical protein